LGRVPIVSGRDLVRALERTGYVVDRQKGSHIILRHTEPPFRRVTVPDHKEVAKGTLRAILRHTGLTADELARLLEDRLWDVPRAEAAHHITIRVPLPLAALAPVEHGAYAGEGWSRGRRGCTVPGQFAIRAAPRRHSLNVIGHRRRRM
jgi:predicted RNA binding protein YcfA (HicA-like mRNA interferase family)